MALITQSTFVDGMLLLNRFCISFELLFTAVYRRDQVVGRLNKLLGIVGIDQHSA